MKCPSCGYLSFDDIAMCKKCGADLRPLKTGEKESLTDKDPLDEGENLLERIDLSDDGIREGGWRIGEDRIESGDEGDSPEAIEQRENGVAKAGRQKDFENDSAERAPDQLPSGGEEMIEGQFMDASSASQESPPPAGAEGARGSLPAREDQEGMDLPGAAAEVTSAGAQEESKPESPGPPSTEGGKGESFFEDFNIDLDELLGIGGPQKKTAGPAVDFSDEPEIIIPGEAPEKEEDAGTAVAEAPFEESPPAPEEETGEDFIVPEVSEQTPLWEEGIPVDRETALFEEETAAVPEDTIPVDEHEETGLFGAADEEPAVFWSEEPAGFVWRSFAFILDNILIAFLVSLFIIGAGAGLVFKGVSPFWLMSNFWPADAILPFYLLWVIISALYFILFHWKRGSTPGKKFFSLKVVAKGGGALELSTAVSRWMAYLVSALPLGLGFLWALFSEEGLAWHDRLAGTMVIVKAHDESP